MKPKAVTLMMKRRATHWIIGSMLALTVAPTTFAETVLYGGLGGHGVSSGPQASTNDGSLVIVSQTDGSTSVVGHPAGVARISGLAFGFDGTLFGATQSGGGYPPPPGPITSSNLIRIDPSTGALISSVPIIAGTAPLFIADLAVHPTTRVLYGTGGLARTETVRDTGSGTVYTIDTTTGAATLVGTTGKFFASIAFAPDGTFYMSSADLDDINNRPGSPFFLMTLDPRTAAVLTQVRLNDFLHSLAVRPTDGVIFGGTADQQGVYTINPATGAASLIGMTSQKDFVGDLAFRPEAAPPPLDLNRHGLTGSWFQPATDGQGVEIEVYHDLIAPGTGLLQGSWFTFDHIAAGGAATQRWYTFSGNVATGQASATLTLYQNVGGNFNALPVTSGVPVGSVVLSFTDCTHATMAYTFTDGSARSGIIPMVRVTPNVTCSTSGASTTNADFGYSGNWYDPGTSGQGIVLELNPNAPAVFFAWYTYAPSGQSQGAAGQRWYTGLSNYAPGARTLPMTLYETTGGLFDSTAPPAHSVAVGTATASFTSCHAGQLEYKFSGGSSAGASGTINLSRVGPAPAGCGL